MRYVLAATACLLLTGCEEECAHEAQSATFAVQGTCGPEGLLHLTAPENRCELEVSGAEALNLPSAGLIHPMENVADAALYDLYEGPWELVDDARRCRTERETGGLKLRCEDTALPAGSCEATLERISVGASPLKGSLQRATEVLPALAPCRRARRAAPNSRRLRSGWLLRDWG
jgi:hypothetical protein